MIGDEAAALRPDGGDAFVRGVEHVVERGSEVLRENFRDPGGLRPRRG